MALIPDSFLEDLKRALPVSQVVQRRCKDLKRAGSEWKCLSPFNKENSPSFTVNDGKQMWHDFSSGKGGDIFAFEQAMTGCTFTAAVETLAQLAGISMPEGSTKGKPRSAPAQQQDQRDDDPPPPDYGPPPGHPAAARAAPRRNITKTYDYTDGDGVLLYQVCRLEWRDGVKLRKTFLQRRPQSDGSDRWVWGLTAGEYLRGRDGDLYQATEKRLAEWSTAEHVTIPDDVAHGLYRFPELMEEMAQRHEDRRTLILVEGEKDAETVAAWGAVATTNSGGARHWLPHHAEYLRGADVVILLDNDKAGREGGHKKAASLRGIARRVRVLDWRVHWQNAPEKADVTDWRDHAGGNPEKLWAIVEKLGDWIPEPPESEFGALRFLDLDRPARELEWLVKSVMTRGEVSIWFGPPGCIEGDAVVTVNRGGAGRQMRLRDLVHCFNGTPEPGRSGRKWRHDIPTNIRCFINGEFRLRRVLGAYIKGIKPVLRLTLADHKTLRLTADHPVLTANGWKRADALVFGENICVNGTLAPQTRKTGKGRYLDDKGYWWVTSGLKHHPFFDGKKVSGCYDLPEHRLVAEARLNGLTLAEWLAVIRDGAFTERHLFLTRNQHVHHDDEDTTNNDPDNLIVLTQSEHSKVHNFQRHLPVFLPKMVAVASILADGATEVFDVTVADAHNFVANGIVVHNCGKTFLITDVGLSIARSVPWMGLRTRPGLVVYQAGEGGLGVRQRLRAYRRFHRIPHDEDVPFVLLPNPVDLYAADVDVNKLIAEIKGWAAFYDESLELVVIDTLSAATPGANENDSADITKILARCRRISRETGAHVALVHHTNAKGDRPRGHSALTGNVENAVEVIRTEQTDSEQVEGDRRIMRDIREFVTVKQKDAPDRMRKQFVLRQVVLGEDVDGDPITSCVVTPLAGEQTTQRNVVPTGYATINPQNLDVFRALVRAIKNHGETNPGSGVPEYERAARVGDWQDALIETYVGHEDITNTLRERIKKKVFRAAKTWGPDGNVGLIGKSKEWVWRTDRKVHMVDAPPQRRKTAPGVPGSDQPDMLLAPGESPEEASNITPFPSNR